MRSGWYYDTPPGMWVHEASGAVVMRDDPRAKDAPRGHRWSAWWTPHGDGPDSYHRTGREAMECCEKQKEKAHA